MAADQTSKLVAFLGNNPYDETTYVWNGDGGVPVEVRTRFVARAAAQMFKVREIVVLATKEASEKNGEGLTNALRSAKLPEPRLVSIPKGQSAGEMWQIFTALKQEIREVGDADGVVLDITNAFRSIPFFAAAVTVFVRSVDRNRRTLRIVYGAYEKGSSTTPVWDVSLFIEVVDWASALSELLYAGKGQDVAERTQRLGQALKRQWALDGRKGDAPDMVRLAGALRDFADDLGTIRTGALLLERNGRSSSALHLIEEARRVRALVQVVVPPLADTLGKLEEMLKPLCACSKEAGSAASPLTGEKGRDTTAALARLYLSMERYAEAGAVLREGWVSIHGSPKAALPIPGQFDQDLRMAAERSFGMLQRETQKSVAQVRNDLEHAGFNLQPLPPKTIREQLDKLVKQYQEAAIPAGAEPCQLGVFVNLSNHPSTQWCEEQRKAALALASEIQDIPFPEVLAASDEASVESLADATIARIPAGATHAMVMGEFTLTMALLFRLRQRGVVGLAACSQRMVVQRGDEKTVLFRFERFRRYPGM